MGWSTWWTVNGGCILMNVSIYRQVQIRVYVFNADKNMTREQATYWRWQKLLDTLVLSNYFSETDIVCLSLCETSHLKHPPI